MRAQYVTDPNFSVLIAQAQNVRVMRKKFGSVTYRTDRANEVNKIFIIWLFENHSGDEPSGWQASGEVLLDSKQSFSLLKPRPNGSKFDALHSKLMKCNVTEKNVQKSMAVDFVPAEFTVALWTSGFNPQQIGRLQVRCFDIKHKSKCSFIDRFSSKILTPKISSNRILLSLLALDI